MSSKILSWDKRCTCCATEHPRMSDSALFVCSSFIVTHCNRLPLSIFHWKPVTGAVPSENLECVQRSFAFMTQKLDFTQIQEGVFKMECACGSVSVQPSMLIIQPLLADWLYATTMNNDWLSLPTTLCHKPVSLQENVFFNTSSK